MTSENQVSGEDDELTRSQRLEQPIDSGAQRPQWP